MKIGQLVKEYIDVIFEYCETTNPDELSNLKDKQYSNKTFGLNFPFCSDLNISNLNSKRYWKDIYLVNEHKVRVTSQWISKHKSKFLKYLLEHGLITKSKYLELENSLKQPNHQIDITDARSPLTSQLRFNIVNSEKRYEGKLLEEAQFMSFQYQKFYSLERSIRDLLRANLEKHYGINWWEEIDEVVKKNVRMNLEYELDTAHTKRSEHKIDYTTFGDLRKIINSNWNIFQHLFNRNLSSVNDVLIDLNRLRVPIAHCTPLAEKEIKRLDIRIDDWNELLKKQ